MNVVVLYSSHSFVAVLLLRPSLASVVAKGDVVHKFR